MASYTEDTREQALTQLMHLYGDSIKRMCGVYLCDMGMADDAAQETFIKAYDHINEWLDGEIGNEKAWLMRIAINTCKDVRRGAWFRHVDRNVALDQLREPSAPDAAFDDSLTRAVMALKPRYRAAVLLCYYKSLTGQEAAQALGVSRATAMNRLRKAKEQIKKALEAWDENA